MTKPVKDPPPGYVWSEGPRTAWMGRFPARWLECQYCGREVVFNGWAYRAHQDKCSREARKAL